MKLFIASTPYNLLNCINMKYNLFPNEKADILISNFDKKNEKYFNNLKNESLFDNVYFVEQRKFNEVDNIQNKLKRVFKKTCSELKNRYFFNSLFRKYCKGLEFYKKYDEFYVDAFGFTPRFIFNHYKKINKNLKVFKVDCGVESYYDASENNFITKKQKFICGKIRKKLEGYYLYDEKIANIGSYKVYLIPKLNLKDQNFINLINRVFEYDDGIIEGRSEKYIFLDQELSDSKPLEQMEEQIVDILNKYINNDYIAKLHPRTNPEVKRYKNVLKMKTNSTFEILCLNNDWITKKCLITPFSTAAALPKLLFDREPVVICLTKLFDNKYQESELATNFFERLKRIYNKKDNIYIPETLEEFEKILVEIKKQL